MGACVTNSDTAHPATQTLPSRHAGRQGPGNLGHRNDLCLNDVATRCHSFFTQKKVKEVFTWQNKVPPNTSKLRHAYCCGDKSHGLGDTKLEHFPEDDPMLAGERTTRPKTCIRFLQLFTPIRIILKEIFNDDFRIQNPVHFLWQTRSTRAAVKPSLYSLQPEGQI